MLWPKWRMGGSRKESSGRSASWHSRQTRAVSSKRRSRRHHDGKRREAGSADDGDGGMTSSAEEGLGPGAVVSLEASMGGRRPGISSQREVGMRWDRSAGSPGERQGDPGFCEFKGEVRWHLPGKAQGCGRKPSAQKERGSEGAGRRLGWGGGRGPR